MAEQVLHDTERKAVDRTRTGEHGGSIGLVLLIMALRAAVYAF